MTVERFLLYATATGTVVTGITSIVIAWKWARKQASLMSDAWDRVDTGVTNVLKEQERVRDDLKTVKQEVTYDGGKSVKDKLRRTEGTLKIERQMRRMTDPNARAEWRKGHDGTMYCDAVTDAFFDLTGLTADKCEHGGWTSCIPDEAERQAARDRYEECAEQGHIFLMEYTIRNVRTGVVARVRHRAEPVEQDGDVFAWIVDLTRLTDRRHSDTDPATAEGRA